MPEVDIVPQGAQRDDRKKHKGHKESVWDILSRLSSEQKWWVSLFLGIIAAIIFSPALFALTSRISSGVGGYTTIQGGSTIFGLFLHALVFILIVRIILM